ncbi:MAG: hypothetical protein PUP93_09535 [Rhizonema sp. NSF051]|nr:hypothetical protein [Rhizonema sp. NSF051]
MRTVKIPFRWTGNALVFFRKNTVRALDREEAAQPGIYLLFGFDFETDTNMIFVGKSGELSDQIKDAEQKAWWSTAVLFTNQGKPLTNSYLDYLQDRIRLQIKGANKVYLYNPLKTEPDPEKMGRVNSPTFKDGTTSSNEEPSPFFCGKFDTIPSTLNEYGQFVMDSFLDKIFLVLSVLNFKVL